METSPLVDHTPYLYGVYATASVVLTIWLARVLQKNGQVFLERVFRGDPVFAASVNQLLVVGFYLVNFGYACLHLAGNPAFDLRTAIETLSTKLGGLLLVLAAMHFANLWLFNRIRKSAMNDERPVAANARVGAVGLEGAPA